MRIVFMYFCKYNAGANSKPPWNPNAPCDPSWKNHLTEGYFWQLRRMVETKIVDEVLVIIESNRGPGKLDFPYPNFTGYVIPEISYLHDMLREDDILFIRGGFRSWHDFIVDHYRDKWKILYAANTGRERWPWWDIILDDLTPPSLRPMIDTRERLWLHYEKPINPNIFYPMDIPKKYDLCIGASHIHDKKGQWKAVEALYEYKLEHGRNLKTIMPGGKIRHGVGTNKIHSMLSELDIELPGFVSRDDLRVIYNQSKVFVHLGGGGQNDRGPLEAMRCGTPLLLSNTSRHGYVTWSDPKFFFIISEDVTTKRIAGLLPIVIEKFHEIKREDVFDHFEKTSGVENIILPQMKLIFDFLRWNPKADKEILNSIALLEYKRTSK